MFKYRCGDQVCGISDLLVPESSLLRILHDQAKRQGLDEVVSTDPHFPDVLRYVNAKYPVYDNDMIKTLDYWGVYQSQHDSQTNEEFMRNNMYNPEFVNNPINTNTYYGLQPMNTFADEYHIFKNTYSKLDGLLFDSAYIDTVPVYDDTVERLDSLRFIFDLARNNNLNVIIAGGYVFNTLMGVDLGNTRHESDMFNTRQSEIDVFMINPNPQDVSNYLTSLATSITSKYYGDIESWFETNINCTRSTDSVSIILRSSGIEVIHINIILKSYKTFSEMLHGFDVDCLCVGWDGKNVWSTDRGRFSLYHGYNTFNYDLSWSSYTYERGEYPLYHELRLNTYNLVSPSYERKLAKYGAMNMSIRVFDINIQDIDPNIRSVDKYGFAYFSGRTMHGSRTKSTRTKSTRTKSTRAKPLHGVTLLLNLESHYKGTVLVYRETGSPYKGTELVYSITETPDYGGSYVARHTVQPYLTSVIYAEENLRTYYSIWPQLERILIDDLGDDFTYTSINTNTDLRRKLLIECNDPRTSPITLIKRKFIGTDIVDILTIDDTVYKMMQVFGQIRISKDVQLITQSSGDYVTNLFTEMIDIQQVIITTEYEGDEMNLFAV